METLQQLRKQAARQRDDAIEVARSEYRRTILKIRQLERYFGQHPKAPTKLRALPDVMIAVMPHDRTFTIPELVELLELANPGRAFHLPTIRTQFHHFATAGMIRRVERSGNKLMLWASADYKLPAGPLAGKNMREAAEIVLREAGPLTTAELVVTLQERGYRADSSPHVLLGTARAVLRQWVDRFKRDRAGRWAVLS